MALDSVLSSVWLGVLDDAPHRPGRADEVVEAPAGARRSSTEFRLVDQLVADADGDLDRIARRPRKRRRRRRDDDAPTLNDDADADASADDVVVAAAAATERGGWRLTHCRGPRAASGQRVSLAALACADLVLSQQRGAAKRAGAKPGHAADEEAAARDVSLCGATVLELGAGRGLIAACDGYSELGRKVDPQATGRL